MTAGRCGTHCIVSFIVGLALGAAACGLAHGQALGPNAGDRSVVCQHGYSRSVRPPTDETDRIKRQKAREQGVAESCCELDHIVPLCIGGAPLDLNNLQLQPWIEAREKDVIEEHTCREWCSGEIELPEALARFKRTQPEVSADTVQPDPATLPCNYPYASGLTDEQWVEFAKRCYTRPPRY